MPFIVYQTIEEVELSFAGMTAKLVDEQQVNNGDIMKIVILETLLILVLLFVSDTFH